MPALLVPVFVAIGFTGTVTLGGATIATALIAANVAVAALTVAGNLALSSVQQRQAKKAARKNAAGLTGIDAQQSVRFSVEPRRRYYGRVKVGGALAFVETKNGNFYSVTMFQTGTCDAIEEWYLAGKAVLIDGDGAVTTPPYWYGPSPIVANRSNAIIQSRRGNASQTMMSVIGDVFPDWDSTHQLNGIVVAGLEVKSWKSSRFESTIGGQAPAMQALGRWSKVWDPRDPTQTAGDFQTWKWSRNPALHTLDYIRVVMQRSDTEIDLKSFIRGANICDQQVARATGGFEPRYTCDGGFSYGEPHRDVVQRLLDTMRGEIGINVFGEIELSLSDDEEPDMTVTTDEIVAVVQLEQTQGLLFEFNAVKATYTSPDHQWQTMPAAVQRNPEAVAEVGREIADESAFPMVTSHSQAQRLAKRELYEDNPLWVGEDRCHPSVLRLMGRRVFRRIDEEDGLDLVCRITKFVIAGDLSSVTIGWESVDPRAYEWNPAVDEGPAPPVPPSTSDDPSTPGPPTGLVSLVETVAGQPRAALRWSATERSGQTYDLQYRVSPGGAWIAVNGLTARSHLTGDLTSATLYDWQVRIRTVQGGVSDWATANLTATAFTATSLLAPTALTPTGGAEVVNLSAVQSASPEAWTVEFSIVAPSGPANWSAPLIVQAAPGVPASTTAVRSQGNYDVFARSRSPFGSLTSSTLGPFTISVTDYVVGAGGSGDGGGNGGSGGGAPE